MNAVNINQEPDVVFLENVEGFETGNTASPGFGAEMRDFLQSIGYTMVSRLIQATDYSSHQSRLRYLAVCFRERDGAPSCSEPN